MKDQKTSRFPSKERILAEKERLEQRSEYWKMVRWNTLKWTVIIVASAGLLSWLLESF